MDIEILISYVNQKFMNIHFFDINFDNNNNGASMGLRKLNELYSMNMFNYKLKYHYYEKISIFSFYDISINKPVK